jgi:hypothetical protein
MLLGLASQKENIYWEWETIPILWGYKQRRRTFLGIGNYRAMPLLVAHTRKNT